MKISEAFSKRKMKFLMGKCPSTASLHGDIVTSKCCFILLTCVIILSGAYASFSQERLQDPILVPIIRCKFTTHRY